MREDGLQSPLNAADMHLHIAHLAVRARSDLAVPVRSLIRCVNIGKCAGFLVQDGCGDRVQSACFQTGNRLVCEAFLLLGSLLEERHYLRTTASSDMTERSHYSTAHSSSGKRKSRRDALDGVLKAACGAYRMARDCRRTAAPAASSLSSSSSASSAPSSTSSPFFSSSSSSSHPHPRLGSTSYIKSSEFDEVVVDVGLRAANALERLYGP
jgi:hypothetical protein